MKHLDPSKIIPVEAKKVVSDDVICVPGGYALKEPEIKRHGNTIEVEGKHYYSQEYVDALLNDKTSGVGVLLDTDDEKEFDRWFMTLLNSNMTGDTSSMNTCLRRDLVRDKKVKKMMRVVWYNNFVRQVEIEDE
jgi:hypothetical protein